MRKHSVECGRLNHTYVRGRKTNTQTHNNLFKSLCKDGSHQWLFSFFLLCLPEAKEEDSL